MTHFIIREQGLLTSDTVNRIYSCRKLEQREREDFTGQVHVQYVRSVDMTYVTRVAWPMWLGIWLMWLWRAQEVGSNVTWQVFDLTGTHLPLPQLGRGVPQPTRTPFQGFHSACMRVYPARVLISKGTKSVFEGPGYIVPSAFLYNHANILWNKPDVMYWMCSNKPVIRSME